MLRRRQCRRVRWVAVLAALVAGSNGSAHAQRFEFKMISSGPNRPGMSLWRSPYRDILVGLHTGTPLADLRSGLGLDEAGLAEALDSLRAEGAVAGAAGTPRPTCMVVTLDEGAALARLAGEIGQDLLPATRRALHALRAAYREIRGLRHLAFDDVSFFLASDVLLDNWQINAVERRWLRAERPRRGRSQYYCALLARAADPREAFGIYGNQLMGLGEAATLGIYGNRRGSRNDLGSLPRTELARMLALPDTTDRMALLGRLTNRLREWVEGGTGGRPEAPLVADLTAMGLVRDGRPLFAVFDPADQRRLDDLAASLTDSVVAHLTRATPRLRQAWTESRWHAETTFEEFGIWWYHFFYTAVTDRLAAEGAIRVPETGLFHYLLIP